SMIAFWPPGPTSNMSMSSGEVWLRLFSVTVTLLTTPVNPEIASDVGYGVAGPEALIVTAVGLQPPGQVPVMVTLKLQVAPVADEQVTGVVPIRKNVPEGGEQLTVPHVPVL